MPEEPKAWVQLTLPRELCIPIMLFAGGIYPGYLYTDPAKPYREGIELDPHITLLYGLEPDTLILQWVQEVVRKLPPLRIMLDDLAIFDCPKYDVLHIQVDPTTELKNAHEELKKLLPAHEREKVLPFVPHVTIAYLKKGSEAFRYFREPGFENLTARFHQVEFMLPREQREKTGPISIALMP